MKRCEGKVAIVTGAASGIGAGCARRLAEAGARVALVDRDERVAGVAAELGAPHVSHLLDVTDEAGWTRVVDEVVRVFGRLDILVNAAGIATWNDIERATLAEYRHVNAVNAEGTFLGCKAAIAAIKLHGQGGSLVNLSSVAGLVGDANAPAYCASKGAVRMLTKSIALHTARKGYKIRCNSVHPSFVATPMVEAVIAGSQDPAIMRGLMERAAPLGHMGEVDDVANAVVYLASDESKFVTGTELIVDGGLTAR